MDFPCSFQISVHFLISVTFCCGITMKSAEILENYGGPVEKWCDPKIVLSRLILHQSMHISFL